jgi:hypothetical protein
MREKETEDMTQYRDTSKGFRRRDRWDILADLLVSYKTYIALSPVVYLILQRLDVVPKIVIGDLEKILIISLVGGLTIGTKLTWEAVENYIEDKRVNILLASVGSRVVDVVKVPREKFAELDVIGGNEFPDRTTPHGSRVFSSRQIDFENFNIVPAGDFPDDSKYPDDISLIGAQGDSNQVMKYRNAMMSDAKRGRNALRDSEFQKESAKNEEMNEIASTLERVRGGNDADPEEMSAEETIKQAEQVLQKMSLPDGEGGDEE